jgi:hypothetical protein
VITGRHVKIDGFFHEAKSQNVAVKGDILGSASADGGHMVKTGCWGDCGHGVGRNIYLDALTYPLLGEIQIPSDAKRKTAA